MENFRFWKWWLFYTSIAFAAFGIVFAIFGDNPLFAPYNTALARIFFDIDAFPDQSDAFRAFIYAPLGATIACSYILLAFIAYFPFAKGERWSWWAITTAFGIWVVFDSAVAVFYQVYFQVYLINLFSILVKALPLLFTYQKFFPKS